MTVPYERTNAVNQTRDFLYSLLDPKQTPRIPKHIRQRARSLLRHYPSQFDMDTIDDKEDGVNSINMKIFGKTI